MIIGGTGLHWIESWSPAFVRMAITAVPASPDTGVNTITGEGLAQVLTGASVVVDVSNSPSFEDAAVMKFFQTSTGNLIAAEATAGVGHHVALSIVGCDRNPDSGYIRAKVAQEKLIRNSSIPYSIVRATQFFEFFKRIADEATDGKNGAHPSRAVPTDGRRQCRQCGQQGRRGSAAERASSKWRDHSSSASTNSSELGLRALHDTREVVADPHARYFGTELDERTLVPDADARLGEIRFEDWLARCSPGRIGLTGCSGH